MEDKTPVRPTTHVLQWVRTFARHLVGFDPAAAEAAASGTVDPKGRSKMPHKMIPFLWVKLHYLQPLSTFFSSLNFDHFL